MALKPTPYQFPADLPKPGDQSSASFDAGYDALGYGRQGPANHALSGPLGQRWEPDYLTITPAEQAHRDEMSARHRENCGGIPDSPDDGGPRAVSSSPFKFG